MHPSRRRDLGLRRVTVMTRRVAVGALALTGVFTVAIARAQPGASKANPPTRARAVAPTSTSTTKTSAPPTTQPPATVAPNDAPTAPTLPPTTATTAPQPPPTTPQTTAQPAPVTSGSS